MVAQSHGVGEIRRQRLSIEEPVDHAVADHVQKGGLRAALAARNPVVEVDAGPFEHGAPADRAGAEAL